MQTRGLSSFDVPETLRVKKEEPQFRNQEMRSGLHVWASKQRRQYSLQSVDRSMKPAEVPEAALPRRCRSYNVGAAARIGAFSSSVGFVVVPALVERLVNPRGTRDLHQIVLNESESRDPARERFVVMTGGPREVTTRRKSVDLIHRTLFVDFSIHSDATTEGLLPRSHQCQLELE